MFRSGAKRGSQVLLQRIMEVTPSLHLCGHNHEGWGLQKGTIINNKNNKGTIINGMSRKREIFD